MEWKDLSNEAKSIIEWVEDPFTGKKLTIEITIGHEFLFPKTFDDMPKSVIVTQDLFNEILQFLIEDNELQYTHFHDRLIFKTKE